MTIWRRFIHTLVRSHGFQNSMAFLVSLYIKLVYYTSRWSVQGLAGPDGLIQQKKSFIACFWHGRLAMIPQMWAWDVPMTALVSGHKDGILVGKIFERFCINYVMGSTNRGGAQALRQTVRLLKNGNHVGMTPDGPRGPREVVNPGVIVMAQLSGAVIIPVSYSVKRYKELRTWDRFRIPLPFNRGIFLWGEPIIVTKEEDQEAARRYLEARLMAIQQQADAWVFDISEAKFQEKD